MGIQTPSAPSGLTVADVVSRGRHPRQKWYQQFSPEDQTVVEDALRATTSRNWPTPR
ncbi:hypothetical protein [Arthrobacter pascens]|uniref:hypothetical protein n=1 Tax=Arthrobacter pascens TaxID=1677 RepID=UPI001F08EBE7|nr:hypothetical protein [Arthrobacter pascens]